MGGNLLLDSHFGGPRASVSPFPEKEKKEKTRSMGENQILDSHFGGPRDH
jgi:hypothetical protein